MSNKLRVHKEIKKEAVKAAFLQSSVEPVSVLGVLWHGGFDSAVKLDSAKRFAESVGQTTVTFFDIDNNGHSLSLNDALSVVLAISLKYQSDLAKKNDLYNAIDNSLSIESVQMLDWL